MKKQYLLFILLLIFPIFISAKTGYDVKAVALSPKPKFDAVEEVIKQYNYFYKMDEENNIISDAEFVLRDLNGNVKYNVDYDDNYRAYKYVNHDQDDYEKLFKIIPSNVKDIISNFNKMEDFTPYINTVQARSTIKNFESMYVDCDNYYDADMKNSDIENEYPVKKLESLYTYSKCYVRVPIVMFLEETKTPKGYEKETAVLPTIVSFNYEFNQETREISNKYAYYTTYNDFKYETEEYTNYRLFGLYKYDNTLDYNNIESVYNAFVNYDISMKYVHTDLCVVEKVYKAEFKNSSINNYQVKKLGSTNNDFKPLCGTPIIVDKKGNSALTVNSYVNSKEEVNLTESSNVEIKVFLKNSGKAPSYENKVVSKVPEGVEYVAGSATDNGVYDEEKNTVTWDLDYLDASSGYIFSYEVAVTTGSKESVYVTTSSVSSDDNETPIVSNEAKVTTPGVGGDAPEEESEEIVNPKTGDERSFVIILGLLIGSIVLFSIKNKKPMGI